MSEDLIAGHIKKLGLLHSEAKSLTGIMVEARNAISEAKRLKEALCWVDATIFPNGIPANLSEARIQRVEALVKAARLIAKLKRGETEPVKAPVKRGKRVFRNETLEALLEQDDNERRKFQRLTVQKKHSVVMELLAGHSTFRRYPFNDAMVKRMRAEYGCD